MAVASTRALGETRAVGLSPSLRHVLGQSDPAAVDRGERSDLLAPAHFGGEVGGVALPVERASSVSAALAPADLPSNGAVAECSLLDLHCALRVSERCSQGVLWQGRLSTTRPTARAVVGHLDRAGKPPVDRVSTDARRTADPASDPELARSDRAPHSLDVDANELGGLRSGVQAFAGVSSASPAGRSGCRRAASSWSADSSSTVGSNRANSARGSRAASLMARGSPVVLHQRVDLSGRSQQVVQERGREPARG